jgi:hypothetical protein
MLSFLFWEPNKTHKYKSSGEFRFLESYKARDAQTQSEFCIQQQSGQANLGDEHRADGRGTSLPPPSPDGNYSLLRHNSLICRSQNSTYTRIHDQE